jgi:hypothetical protein
MEDDDQFNMEESDSEERMPHNVPEMENTALEAADLLDQEVIRMKKRRF